MSAGGGVEKGDRDGEELGLLEGRREGPWSRDGVGEELLVGVWEVEEIASRGGATGVVAV